MKRTWVGTWTAVALASSLLGCGEEGGDQGAAWQQKSEELASKSFDVDFANCSEFAGIGSVPRANALPLVPSGYTLVGDSNSATLVVRVAHCESVSIDGKPPKAATVSQIGIGVTHMDPYADIDNYTLWFSTDLGQLHGKLTSAGVHNDLDANLAFVVDTSGHTLSISSTPPHGPDYQVNSDPTAPLLPPGMFAANWWADGTKGTVVMHTDFPDIQFSFPENSTLTTPAGSALADLIGGTSMTFDALDSYNTFPVAAMTVDGG